MDRYTAPKSSSNFIGNHSPFFISQTDLPLENFETDQVFPFLRSDQSTNHDGVITWKQRQEQRRRKLERSIEILKSIDMPGQAHAIRYLEHLYRRHCKWRTIQNVRITVYLFLKFLKQIDRQILEQVTRNDLAAFIEHEQDRGLKPKSVQHRLQTLYAFFRFLDPDNIIHSDVLSRKIKIRLPQLLPRAMETPDVVNLLSAISSLRDRALILVLLRTGMRIGELLNLTVNDVDFQIRTIKIYEGEKNSVGRVVYLSDDAEKALGEWFNIRNPHKAYVFYGQAGPLSYTGARRIFKRYIDEADLSHKGYTLHCLRHTFATDLLNAGMRLECLQQLLGHATIEVTRIYAKLSDQTREEEYFKAMAKIERGVSNEY